jgi:signal transduction histidine kinase
VPETGDELERLGTTLNEMLGRLETALEREREFVADAGHELRTPLALLRTELELALRQGTTVEELRDAILMSSREADRLSQLAEDLLLIASADRGRLPLRREPVSVDQLFGGIVTRFELQARESGKSVRAVPAQGLTVDGDLLRLQQALGNLVDNALRYGGSAIRLEADEQGLHVRDDGPGFASGFLPHAFERFSRGDGARGGGGAGLGLSIVHAIAEAHGGSAHVRNVNGGADAWFSLGR